MVAEPYVNHIPTMTGGVGGAAAVAGSGNNLDLTGFHLSVVMTAGLVAAGGIIGLVGLWRRRRLRT